MGKIAGLPEDLADVATKLQSYGYDLRKESSGIWVLLYPPGDPSGIGQAAFLEGNLRFGLLQILRTEEQQRNVLFRYEQFDQRWGSKVYGIHKDDTTIAAAGCGPSSLAIVLQYLMNNGSRPRNACVAITPEDTAKYAATHGRVSGRGTAGARRSRLDDDRSESARLAPCNFEEQTQMNAEDRSCKVSTL